MSNRRRSSPSGAYFIQLDAAAGDRRYMKALDRPSRKHAWYMMSSGATRYESLDEAQADERWYLGDSFGEVSKRAHVVRRAT